MATVVVGEGTFSVTSESAQSLTSDGSDNAAPMIEQVGSVINGTDAQETLEGTAGDDEIYGFGGDDIVLGEDGDDYLVGGAGNDVINGAGDVDTVAYVSGGENNERGVTVNLSSAQYGLQAPHTATDTFGDKDTLISIEEAFGTMKDDVFVADSTSYNGFWGLAGKDTFIGNGRTTFVYYHRDEDFGGTAGITVNLSNVLQGTQAAHSATDGFGFNDTLTAVENIRGTSHDDVFFGDDNANTFQMGAGDDRVDGGGGDDRVDYSTDNRLGTAAHGVFANLSGQAQGSFLGAAAAHTAIGLFGDIDTLISIEEVKGSQFDDVLIGESAPGVYQGFWGLGGSDTIIGGGANSWVYYDEDARFGGSAGVVVNLSGVQQGSVASHTATDGFGDTDSLTGIANVQGSSAADTIFGNDDANNFQLLGGDDYVDGGLGEDAVRYDRDDDGTATHGALVNLSGQTFTTATLGTVGPHSAIDLYGGVDTLVSIEDVTGSELADYIIGNAQNNVLIGGDGDDTMIGGDGDDTLIGGRGIDTMDGRGGLDTVDYSRDVDDGATHGVVVNLLGDAARPELGLGADSACDSFGDMDVVTNIRNVIGTQFDDVIYGGNHANTISAGSGNDILLGGVENDVLDGGAGTDTAKFSGNRADYLITQNGDGSLSVADQRAGTPDGIDTLRDVEILQFADRSVPAEVNTSPSFPADPLVVAVDENSTAVATAVATDQNATDTISYSIVGGDDSGKFTIDSSSGKIAFVAAPDYENPDDANGDHAYQIVVQASDGLGGLANQTILVSINNLNDSPLSFTSPPTANFAENGTGPAYEATTFDADNLGLPTYSLSGADAALFDIDASSGLVTFKASPDFEAPKDEGGDNVYSIVVHASNGPGPTSLSVQITVTDVMEGIANVAPVITSDGGGDTAAVSVLENTTTVTTVAASDPDLGQTLKYSIAGGFDGSLFTIDEQTGALSFVHPQDYENPDLNGGAFDHLYDVQVRATDNLGAFDDQLVTVSVTNANDVAPIFTSQQPPVFTENHTGTAYQASAYDPDNLATVTYSLGGTDAALFDIDATTGSVTFKASPDYEAPADANHDNVYDVVVTASDGALSTDKAIAVMVGNVADVAPVIVSPTTATFAENQSGAVYDAEATDVDNPGLLHYSVSGDDAALFDIDDLSGVVTFKAASDFEAPADVNHDNVYNIVVTASDTVLTGSQAVAISVTNFNDNAPAFTSGGTATFAENAIGTVYDANATDADNLSALTYTLSGADAARFNIDGTTGIVTFKAPPDFETPGDAGGNNVYEVVVAASDGTFSSNRAVAITVTNASEGGTITGTNGNNTLSGTGGNDVIDGGAGNDTLNGLGGDDRLIGGTGADTLNGGTGADLMQGGAGGDTYVVSDTGDVVDESVAGSAGVDLVQSSITFSLLTSTTVLGDFENLTLTGTSNIDGTGNALANVITGNGADNHLYGGGGIDTLVGGAGNDLLDGGTGNDLMQGGAGNDTYVVDSAGDRVDEIGGNGTDTVMASTDFNLSSGRVTGSVENLVLTGTADIDATGNALNNVLVGNGADNVLDGGAGRDPMQGGAGDDTYVVDNANDTVDESAAGSGGIDTVRTSLSFSLATSAHVLGQVENLVLTGNGDVNGTGNDLDNAISGNSGDNVLSGGAGNDVLDGGRGDDRLDGGTAADIMIGGRGDDILIVDNVGDRVNENAGEGNDTVQTSLATFTLSDNVENLVYFGTENFTGAGNSLNNTITGGIGSDHLAGGGGNDVLAGGAGSDFLTGGTGNDQFMFNVVLSQTGVDAITDFHSRAAAGSEHDRIVLSNAGGMFSQLADGTLSTAAFAVSAGGQAHDGGDRIIYDPTNGWLTYDANGSAAGGNPVHFATLQPGLNLQASDFVVI